MDKRISVIVLLVVMAILCAGCISGKSAWDSRNVGNTPIVTPIDYGNGVYYFDSQNADFGNSLSHFIETHPGYEVTAIAASDLGGYGHTIGYFVVVKKVNP